MVYQKMGQPAAAHAAFLKAKMRRKRQYAKRLTKLHVMRTLGRMLAYLGEKEAAIAEAKRATELLPETVDAFSGPGMTQALAEVYMVTGENAKAIELLDRLLSRPNDVTVACSSSIPTWIVCATIRNSRRCSRNTSKGLEPGEATRAVAVFSFGAARLCRVGERSLPLLRLAGTGSTESRPTKRDARTRHGAVCPGRRHVHSPNDSPSLAGCVQDFGADEIRPDCHWRRTGRLCRRDPRRPARKTRGLRGEGARRRHLPQLGLHPDQIAAAQRRAVSPDEASRGRLRLHVRQLAFDWSKVIKRSRDVADKNAGGIEYLFKKNKVDYILGEALARKGRAK